MQKVLTVRLSVALLVVVGAAILLSSTDKPVFTADQKAFYADPNLVNFVRPGLVVKIISGEVGADGTIKCRFKLTDPKGLPLDREGITTPGAVNVRLLAARIPRGQTQYVAYNTRTVVSPITNRSGVQATFDSGGTFQKVAEGEYIYTFATKAPAGFDRTVTHSIGVYASRDLSEFDLDMLANYDDEVHNFVPDGSRVTVTRDLIRTETCNKCHDVLRLHGNRRSVELCVLCHTPQSVDPDTGNTVDMPVMTHKIHMGSSLPSVQAGRPYRIIGYRQSVHDYSEVVFPADVRNCVACHAQNTGAAQATAYLKPNRVACGACHDNVNFATGEGHANLPQVSDNQCANCHVPQGELEFDVSIRGAHTVPTASRDLPGTTFEILAVTDGAAGKRPTVTFSIKDKTGKPIPPSEMSRLAMVLAGPTSDYPSYISEDALRATGTQDGRYFWTFQNPIPANAKGSYTVGIEGYRNITLLPGTTRQQTVRDAGVNKVFYFPVDGSRVAPRRQVVTTAKCNNCHFNLSLHGGNRNQVEQCLLCHNPNRDDSAVRPAAQMPAESIDLRHMVHKIHTGHEIEGDYTIYGRGGTPHNYNHVGYPGDRRNCSACHVNGSENPPLRAGLLDVKNPRGHLTTMGPETAACLGCHTSLAAASHALANTTRLGESCSACHAAGREFGVPKAHAR